MGIENRSGTDRGKDEWRARKKIADKILPFTLAGAIGASVGGGVATRFILESADKAIGTLEMKLDSEKQAMEAKKSKELQEENSSEIRSKQFKCLSADLYEDENKKTLISLKAAWGSGISATIHNISIKLDYPFNSVDKTKGTFSDDPDEKIITLDFKNNNGKEITVSVRPTTKGFKIIVKYPSGSITSYIPISPPKKTTTTPEALKPEPKPEETEPKPSVIIEPPVA